MTVLAFTPPSTTQTDQNTTAYIPSSKRSRDRWIAVGAYALILGICCAAVFTGGLSLNTVGVEINLTGSLSQGMQLHFAPVNS